MTKIYNFFLYIYTRMDVEMFHALGALEEVRDKWTIR